MATPSRTPESPTFYGPAQGEAYPTAKLLASDAVTHDWPSFLGPTHDAVSTETHLSQTLPPPLLWELAMGRNHNDYFRAMEPRIRARCPRVCEVSVR